MSTLAYILRVISLSFLFAGSTTMIFTAITLVKAGEAAGVPATQTAGVNAPMFYMFSIVMLVCGILLLLGEALDYAKERRLTPSIKARYASSLICVAAAMVYSFGIVPQMQQLHAAMKDSKAAEEQSKAAHRAFEQFHKASQMDMSVIIVCALVSLLLPGFESQKNEVGETAKSSGDKITTA
jgi:hypothetical protein